MPESPTTIPDLFRANPPGNPFLILPSGEALSFGEIADRADRFAGGLQARGVGSGDIVAIWLPNVPEWVVACLGAMRLGAGVLPLNTRFRAQEVGNLVRRTRAKALVSAPYLGKVASAEVLAYLENAALESLRLVVLVGADGVDAPTSWPKPTASFAALGASAPAAPGVQPDDICVLFSTSGTTREPKLVPHRHRTAAAHARDIARGLGLDQPDTRMLQFLPFCGAFGFSQLIGSIAAGAPSVLIDFNAEQAVRMAREFRVTNMIGTNEMLARMLGAVSDEKPFPDLRYFGHANFDPALIDLPEEAERRGVHLRGLFGMSETMALFAIQPADADLSRRQASGGRPVSSQAVVRARSVETQEIQPPGSSGEIEIRTPNLMAGYLGDEAATRAAMTEEGFFRTGDLGYTLDDGGFIHLGRIGDVMRLAGFLVSPLEIEAVILEDPDVQACQVVDIPRPAGARPVAFVLPAGPTQPDENQLLDRCRARLAPFKVPVRVFTLDSFPTVEGANGVKVKRGELRSMALAQLAEEA
jgi:fatty-acyl-CoA synthase